MISKKRCYMIKGLLGLFILLNGLLLSAADNDLSFKQPKITFKQRSRYQSFERFETFQLAFWYKFPDYTWDSKVEGLKVGFPISAGIGSVKGLELTLFGAATAHINGMQFAFGYCRAKTIWGLQLSCVNIFADGPDSWQVGMINNAGNAGVQLGLINYARAGSMQFGLINIITNGPIPFTLFFNYADTAPKSPYAGRK